MLGLLRLLLGCCSYIPETEEYLAEIGHWWENESEPDLKPEVTLASEFSDLEVDGSSSVDADQDNADNENDDDTAGPDDDAAQLGRVFGTQF